MYLTCFKASVRPATALAVLEASSLEHGPCLDYVRPTTVACMSGTRHQEALLGEAFKLRLDIAIAKSPKKGHQSGYVSFDLVSERPADS